MKKLSTLFVTTLLALGLALVTTSAMAAPKGKDNGSYEAYLCLGLKAAGFLSLPPFNFKNVGQCVTFFKNG